MQMTLPLSHVLVPASSQNNISKACTKRFALDYTVLYSHLHSSTEYIFPNPYYFAFWLIINFLNLKLVWRRRLDLGLHGYKRHWPYQ